MRHTSKDMTLPPDLTAKKGSGPVRSKFPIYSNSLPPCNHACPTGSNIQEWLALAQEEEYEAAFQALIKNNPMPAIHGRVCYHPCESVCNRNDVDQSVSIHAVERYLGDQAIEHKWPVRFEAKPSGKRVLIIGAGPSGLATAYHLKRKGHDVEIRDSAPMAGGMMHFGIPAYRLPRKVLDQEIQRIEDMGIKIVLNTKVESILAEKVSGQFDAVFLAIGAHIGRGVDIPNADPEKVTDAVSYLRDVELGKAPKLGNVVVVYGGGNTAMDAARTAKRFGAQVKVVYRRDRANMPAHDFECVEAMEEGVEFHWQRTINQIDGQQFTLEKMVINAEGKPQPTGEFETLQADSLILALGQNIDTKLTKAIPDVEHKWDGSVVVNDNMMTGYKGLFAGGDMVPCDRTVTIAVGHGKKAAANIDAFLKGRIFTKVEKTPLIKLDKLHLWYKTDAEQSEQPATDPVERRKNFDEVLGGLTEQEALYEAQRCYSCGNCFECNGCLAACPHGAITYLGKGKGYKVDYDKCTGCNACYSQCPCHAIEMVAAEQA
ncbi:NAD(P)-binding protein [Shewanella benthica]|uniref:NAD(P)-binding protein n=1 Tax=Shewanella benthica TaxID=43661 RepID=UPI00187AA3AE|nr:NAD(P)-binding protein [Shewanella benthica]MBE7215855.1 NAD(P)-binding protein [Shewanella benthica]MCL1063548.1 NAD(P)-binding protein [Shewanella benthica]